MSSQISGSTADALFLSQYGYESIGEIAKPPGPPSPDNTIKNWLMYIQSCAFGSVENTEDLVRLAKQVPTHDAKSFTPEVKQVVAVMERIGESGIFDPTLSVLTDWAIASLQDRVTQGS